MRIGFFGTPELAVRVLADLKRTHDVRFVVTAVDKETGRNREVQFCPVKKLALGSNIPLLQPKSLKDQDVIDLINSHDADIYVVVAYGSLIPRAIFDHPLLKTINLHPSLLPRYRGAAPIQWALINGERETGITVQLINEKLDAGDIVIQESVNLDADMTAADLTEIVASRGAHLLGRAIHALASGNPKLIRQDEAMATFCRKIDRDVAIIDWNKTAEEIHNLVRGLNPKPVAFSSFRGENIKIWKTSPVHEDAPGTAEPGLIVRYKKKRLLAGTGRGFIEILGIQPANKKIMDGLSFINGYRLTSEERFG
jgi:methionyl-tRNA formyltransferase